MPPAKKIQTKVSSSRIVPMIPRIHPALANPSPAAGAVPKGAGDVWVEPRIVVEVRYTDVTETGQLRHPVFLQGFGKMRGDNEAVVVHKGHALDLCRQGCKFVQALLNLFASHD